MRGASGIPPGPVPIGEATGLPGQFPRVEAFQHLAQAAGDVTREVLVAGADAVHQLDDALDQTADLAAVDAEVGGVPIHGDLEQEDGGEGDHGMCEDGDSDDGVADVGLFEDHVQTGHGG